MAKAYLDLRDRRGLPPKLICSPAILLASGSEYNFEHPELSTYTIEDVAQSLAKIARMGGHNLNRDRGYSVGQHSVLGSYMAPAEERFPFLMHDAPEFVLGDVMTPFKQLLGDYHTYYRKTELDMARRFHLPPNMSKTCKEIDTRMFATERRDLMPGGPKEMQWEVIKGVEPYEFRITEWTIKATREAFLDRYHELWPEHLRWAREMQLA